jgi:hypothetical protein
MMQVLERDKHTVEKRRKRSRQQTNRKIRCGKGRPNRGRKRNRDINVDIGEDSEETR